ncbi:MAG: heparinase II/III family protein [Planctomycetes bacterium]|nr:heparinase II/III family protein [Planctomycetota bacterium]
MAGRAFPTITREMVSAGRDMFPELTRFLRERKTFAASPRGRAVLRGLKPILDKLYPIPCSTYTLYRTFYRTGNRTFFQDVTFRRRTNMNAAVMGWLLAPCDRLLEAVHDYLMETCQETTWILHAHERGGVDLMATETAFCLAEIVHVMGEALEKEVRERVEYEVYRQVLQPYIENIGLDKGQWVENEPNLTEMYLNTTKYPGWFKYAHNNWNGVCNSSVGAAMLYFEKDSRLLAKTLNEVLSGLSHFMEVAFEEDGTSTEGTGYWQYGLTNFIAFSELLYNRTGGKVNLLEHPKMKRIAQYPLQVHLGRWRFYNHADCAARLRLTPGTTAMLARRTETAGLMGLADVRIGAGRRLPTALRDMLWWDGRREAVPPVKSTMLRKGAVWRLKKGSVIVAGKAGHNQECHNHNDVGSFVVHSRGDDLLCDPGAPVYCRDFFSGRRYELFMQANSMGHNVPVIGGKLQGQGREYAGEIREFDAGAVEMELAGAYGVKGLGEFVRRIEVSSGAFTLEDRMSFKGEGAGVEEAFVTWLPVRIKGGTATVKGEKTTLTLTIEKPARAKFKVSEHELGGTRPEGSTLRRITVNIPAGAGVKFLVKGTVKGRRRHGKSKA